MSQSIQLAQRERNAVLTIVRSTTQNATRNRNNSASSLNPNDQALRRLEQRIIGYNNRYFGLTRQMSTLQQSAALTLRNYQVAIKQYENGTGQIVRQNVDLSKLKSQVERQNSKLQKSQQRKTVGANQAASRLRRFSTYVAFDIAAEQQRLLQSFAASLLP